MKKLFLALLVASAVHVNAQEKIASKPTTTIQNFRLALHGGFSWLTAKTSDQVPAESKAYVAELKSGYHYGVDATYFIKNTLGIGAKFSQFKTSNSGGTTIVDGMSASLAEDITHTFIAPSFSTKYSTINQKHHFIFAIGLGYLGYHDDAVISGVPITATGGTFGSAIDAAYDLSLTKNFAIGAQIAFVGGSLSKITYEANGRKETVDLGKDQKESLTRFDLSFGARFNF
jgi:hypothetical protein